MLARLVGHRHRSGMSKLIARADNEVLKCVLGNEIIVRALGPVMLSLDLSFRSSRTDLWFASSR